MSKPVMYDKEKWDTATGLDYSGTCARARPKYTHHDFPPLFKNTELISQCHLEGRGDAAQVVKHGDYVYICHLYSGGFSVVNVKDPKNPKVVKFIPTDSPHVWSLKCRAVGNILIVANEWKFFEPQRYHVRTDIQNFHLSGPKEPIESGIKIYDISNPEEPRLLSFFKTGQWTKEGGGNYCHRFWFDGHYAYVSAEMPGYWGGILVIVDVSDPQNPREVSRFWRKGQWIAGGERPWWPADSFPGAMIHHATVQGDRAYAGWFALGGVILDISNIRKPTLVSEFNLDFGGQAHTFLPIKNREFAVFNSEYTHAYMLDIRDEKHPKVVGMFPKAPKELEKRGKANIGIHNIHENPPNEYAFRSDDIIYTTSGCAGVRIFDVSDPYRIEEIGHYVPGTPEVYYSPFGAEGTHPGAGMDVMDLFVDTEGLIYCSRYNGGLEILKFTG